MPSLRRLRLEAGLTQDELGQQAGVSGHTIAQLETGRQKARPGTMRRIAAALRVAVADVIEFAEHLPA
jgi:DNA-binding XRE family transcriptional regulator